MTAIAPIRTLLIANRGEIARRIIRSAHALGIATDIDMRALLQPLPEQSGLLQHAMLYVDLLGLIARERGIQTGQHTTTQPALDLATVEKILAGALIAKEQPVGATRRGKVCSALHAPAKRRKTVRCRCQGRS